MRAYYSDHVFAVVTLKTKTWTVIEEIEFSEFVTNLYGRPYSLQQAEELGQDTIRHASTDKPSDEDQAAFDEWKSRPLDKLPNPRYEQFRELWEKDDRYKDLYPEFIAQGGYEWISVWQREITPPLDALMHDLFLNGHLEEGEYALHVWW